VVSPAVPVADPRRSDGSGPGALRALGCAPWPALGDQGEHRERGAGKADDRTDDRSGEHDVPAGRADADVALEQLADLADGEAVYLALRSGASGFLLKDLPPEQLASAVRTASRGDTLLAPAITRRLIEHFTATSHPPASPEDLGQLTPRETEVLRLLATGLSNAEIAAALFVAETTLKTHVARMLTKLGLRDRVQAVVFAYQHGLVPARPSP
jgi:DNA-binding CsgD family transcriptional regulator